MNHNEEKEILQKLKSMPDVQMQSEERKKVMQHVLTFEDKWNRRDRRNQRVQKVTKGIMVSFATIMLMFSLFTNEGKQITGDIWSSITSPSEEQQLPKDKIQEDQYEDEPTSKTVDEIVELDFEPIPNEILVKTELPKEWTQHKIVEVDSFPNFKQLKIHLYEDDEEFFYAYLEDDEQNYYLLGDYGHSEIQKMDSIQIEVRERFDIGTYLEIEGGGGAISVNKQFFGYNESMQEWINWDMTNTTEEDLNHDGKPLLVVTSRGSAIPFVFIKRWNGEQFEQADVGQAIGKRYAILHTINGKTWIQSGNGENSSIYRYEDGKLIRINDQEARIIETISMLRLHVNKNHIIDWFGNEFEDVLDAKNNIPMWRYDLGVTDNYLFDSNGSDTVDLKAIKNGSVQMQLFVSWSDNGTVQSYVVYYKGKEGQIREYRKNSDGSEKETVINF
jgi:hypothetical protein